MHCGSMKAEPGADRGPRAGSPRGVVDATGSHIQLECSHPVATAPGSALVDPHRTNLALRVGVWPLSVAAARMARNRKL